MVDGKMVCMSFNRWEDTIRHSFVSHLSAEFHRKGISFFASEESDAAIEKAKVSVVILSEKSVSTDGFLNELVKVSKCRSSNGLLVVPVFYRLTKSELRKHCLKLKNIDWRHALLEIADLLPGYASSFERSDSELVEEIVADVREKLDLTGKIGVYTRLMKIENLLCKQPSGIRSVGIWGMGGIGKTTLAKAAFKQLSGEFEASCFIKDFDKDFQENGAYGLLEKHLRKQLGLGSHVTRLSLLIDTLRHKRVLVVLDDVRKPLGATNFLSEFDWLGSGSLIIITSRDRQALVQCQVNEIYEVQGLNKHEALQLFSRSAFGKDVADQKHMELCMKFVDYADGNPLALTIYGEELVGKTQPEMESVIRNRLPDKIFNEFKSSYDALGDSDKEIFLEIVFSFRGENVDNVMQFLAGCGFFPRVGIDLLVDKSLVTISENRVQLHNLIYDVGLRIIKDPTEEIGMAYRFVDASNIQSLVEAAPTIPGNEDIKAICLDTSNLAFKGHIAFQHMYDLRSLKISSSHLTKDSQYCPQSLPPELRLLHWKYYPLQSFPQDFDVHYLVELNMSCSKLRKLWGGTKNLEVLKRITLSHSLQLVNVDELQYSPNIEIIDLQGCSSLQSFPDMGQSQHLRVVKLKDCSHLRSLPNMVTFYSLQVLDLSGCSELEEIQGFPQNLKKLYLAKTAIREIPSSLCNHISKLVTLDMENCKRLWDLPVGMGNMEFLGTLKLSGCSNLEKIDDLPRNLKELYLAGTAVKALPSTLLENLSELIILSLENCKKLLHLPTGMSKLKSLVTLKLSGCSELETIQDFPKNLKELFLVGTAIKKLPSSIGDLAELDTLDLKNCKRLRHLPTEMQDLLPLNVLDLSNCSELEVITSSLPKVRDLRLTVMPLQAKLPSSFSRLYAHIVTLSLYKAGLNYFPEEIRWMLSLKTLDLSGNGFRNVPISIKEFSKLVILRLRYCKNLIDLPPLPGSLQVVNVHGCSSLSSISFDSKHLPRYYTFSNCFFLPPREVFAQALALESALALSLCLPSPRSRNSNINLQTGSSVMIRLDPYSRSMVMSFAILVEISFSKEFHDGLGFIKCVCKWDDKKGHAHRLENIFHCWAPGEAVPKIKKDHMFVFFDLKMHRRIFGGDVSGILADLFVFELSPVNKEGNFVRDSCRVTKCGVHVIFDAAGSSSRNTLTPLGSSFDPDDEVKTRLRVNYGSSSLKLPRKTTIRIPMGRNRGLVSRGEGGVKMSCNDTYTDGAKSPWELEECVSNIISFTSPRDACDFALVSKTFESAVEYDIVWEKFLPPENARLIVPQSPSFLSKKELYFALCDFPVLIDDGKQSVWIEKASGKMCIMLSARNLSIAWGDDPRYWQWIPSPEARFEEVALLIDVCWFDIRGRTNTHVLSPRTRYSAYIVFKRAAECRGFEDVGIEATVGVMASRRLICFDTDMDGKFQRRRSNLVKPDEREDGWMEVELGDFFNVGGLNSDDIEMSASETKSLHWKRGLIIQGIEIRPTKSRENDALCFTRSIAHPLSEKVSSDISCMESEESTPKRSVWKRFKVWMRNQNCLEAGKR